MNLPFGLTARREVAGKNNQSTPSRTTAMYENMLSQYRDSLEKAHECMKSYLEKQEINDDKVLTQLSNRISELKGDTEKYNHQLQAEILTNLDKLTTKVNKGKALLRFLIILSILSLGGSAFLVLYVLDVIAIY